MTHAQLVEKAVHWLRRYRCGVVLSEQACVSGEMPDAIGWKRACHSVLVECKVTRSDFLADRAKAFRLKPDHGVGCERFYLAPAGLVRREELPAGWGLLEHRHNKIETVARLCQESPQRHWLSLRNESAARQPAPRRGPRRTPKHHRLPQMEESHGRIQSWHLTRGIGLRRRRAQRIPRTDLTQASKAES